MKKLLVYLKDYKKESVLGPLFKLLEATFELIVPDWPVPGHQIAPLICL